MLIEKKEQPFIQTPQSLPLKRCSLLSHSGNFQEDRGVKGLTIFRSEHFYFS